jgi:hypothetical protein
MRLARRIRGAVRAKVADKCNYCIIKLGRYGHAGNLAPPRKPRGTQENQSKTLVTPENLAPRRKPWYSCRIRPPATVSGHGFPGLGFSRYVVYPPDELRLDFDCHRHLRLLCRRGFLTCQVQGKASKAVYQRSETWPPAEEFFREGVAIRDPLPPRLPHVRPGRHRS